MNTSWNQGCWEKYQPPHICRYHPIAESEEELKSLLMEVKKESEKAGLNFNSQKTKIMAYGPITSWQIDGEKVKAVTDFIFLGSRVAVDSDCSHKIKTCLLLGRKSMTNLDSILKSRDITLLTKIHLVKARVFPVDMYEYESWTKELMFLNCTAGEELKPANPKEINPEYSLEGLMLKLQYFQHLM